MGGKGRKRREKNYRAAHGGNNRLPPPPDPSAVDAVPSKLRQIMAFTNSSQTGSVKESGSRGRRHGGSGTVSDQNVHSNAKLESKSAGPREEGDPVQHIDHNNDAFERSAQEKRKKTKKRKRVKDLRFETVEESGIGSKRRERKKKRLEERKKKRKKARSEGTEDFPGHEHIKFGEVVEAPPKLITVPKALKTPQEASQERLRLKAVEAYRNRKGWATRPGIDLPPPVLTLPSF
ncbi:hypothetical protein NMG60_11022984 [Bertholletia excelsa]